MADKSSVGEIVKEVVSCVETKELGENTRITFTIYNFSELNVMINSEKFNIGSNEWYINVNPKYARNDSEFVSVFLCTHLNKSMVRTKFVIFIIDSNNKQHNEWESTICEFNAGGYRWGSSVFIDKNFLYTFNQLLLPKNRLTIAFDIEVLNESESFSNEKFNLRMINNKDFKIILKNESGVCQEYFVSKAILSHHSIYFEEIFASIGVNKEDNELTIVGVEIHLFEAFLTYVYFGKLDELETMSVKLFHLSIKLGVNQLESICEDFIYSKITAENAIRTLIFAQKYYANKLKFRTVQYIAHNLCEVRKSSHEEWIQLLRERTLLADKIFELISNEKSIINSEKTSNECVIRSYIYHNIFDKMKSPFN